MIGDIYVVDGVEMEVVWAGGEGLIPSRATRVSGFWTAPKRLYNKKAEYWAKTKNGLNCPECGGTVGIVEATAMDQYYGGNRPVNHKPREVPRETTILACSRCEYVVDLRTKFVDNAKEVDDAVLHLMEEANA